MSEIRTSHSGSTQIGSPAAPVHEPPPNLVTAPGHTTPAPSSPVQSRRRTLKLAFGSALLVAVAVAAVALLATRRTASAEHEASRRTADVARGPLVRSAPVTLSNSAQPLALLGEARPYLTVTLYAKVSGYLQKIGVDIGDQVTSGQVLATVESPETDRAYLAAKADFDNKQVISQRIDQLLQRKLVSPQESDQARTDAAMAHERLNALSEEQGYETLRAPFTGTVTARFADPGALVQNAASNQTSSLPVVTVAETDSLRVFIYLDQSDAAHVRAGTPAVITLTERAGVRVPAHVSRLSGQLDPKTRKMSAEIDVANRDGTIVPGSFVSVELAVPALSRPQAPVEALLVRDGRTMVALVGADSHVHFKPVVVTRNDGRTVTFGGGVAPGDRVALNLGEDVSDGALVQLDSASTTDRAAAAAVKERQP